jgi:outer membrane lipoprotein-sorting protein
MRMTIIAAAIWIASMGPPAFTQSPSTGTPPSSAQVQQLQEQLTKMQAEMGQVQQSQQAENLPAPQREALQQHIFGLWEERQILL